MLVLLSGGASANWIAPAAGITLAEKQAVTRALLRSGAAIGEMNCVRKHLSRIKGGRLAQRAYPAKLVTLAISDVPGDDPAVIGSGRRCPIRPRSPTPARSCADYRLDLPDSGDPRARRSRQRDAEAGRQGLRRLGLSDRGAAGRCAGGRRGARRARPAMNASCSATACRARRARSPPNMPGLPATIAPQGRRAAILSGGELTVTLRGKGRGGPNQEYALALAIHLDGAPGIAALAADTDGTDGGGGRPDDPAGAFIDPTTLRAPGRPASIPPRFSPTTIPRGFSMASAICSGPVRRSPT